MGRLPEAFLTPFPVSVSKAWKAAGIFPQRLFMDMKRLIINRLVGLGDFFGSSKFNMVIFSRPNIRYEMVEWFNWRWIIIVRVRH